LLNSRPFSAFYKTRIAFVPTTVTQAVASLLTPIYAEHKNRAVHPLTAGCDERTVAAAATAGGYNGSMPISARNKLRGKIEEIQLGDIMAHVVVRVGDNLIESAITRRSADELKLKKGDTVTAVVKATEVMIQKD